MNSTSRSVLFLLILLAGTERCASQTAPPSRSTKVEPIVTKERLFSIPYYLNPNTQRPAEVHLYVSGDQGDNWFHYQKRLPEQGKFDFQAGEEGTYWFVVRTDRDSRRPDKSALPEKIVTVGPVQAANSICQCRSALLAS